MRLLFLTADNLRDSFFIKDLVHNLRPDRPTIVLHDHFSVQEKDTRFVTRRLSALMSETMVYNHAFSGDQRQLFSMTENGIAVRLELLRDWFTTAPVVVLNCLGSSAGGTIALPALEVARVLQVALPIEQTIVFTRNHQSPLAAARTLLETAADLARLLALYEEEATALNHAHALAPALIASPANFAL